MMVINGQLLPLRIVYTDTSFFHHTIRLSTTTRPVPVRIVAIETVIAVDVVIVAQR